MFLENIYIYKFQNDCFQALNLWTGQESIAQCSNEQIIYIINDITFNPTEKTKSLIDHKESFISFLKETKLNGEQIMNYDRKIFASEIISHCNDNQKLFGPSLKLLKHIKAYKLNEIPFNKNNDTTASKTEYIEEKYDLPKAKSIPIQENQSIPMPKSIEECKSEHIIHILNESIFKTFEQTLINDYRSNIIEYIQLSKLSGQQIIEMNRTDFAQDIVKFCADNEELKKPLMKLYKAIKTFTDFKSLY